ncbi:MAG TPA: (2Fe-2S) ferredoxin domain-containing protein [Syntrophales bacterium]|nr:(2Fe-2S) ferredoxin domain-containing protein [Syntrophales bacterium]
MAKLTIADLKKIKDKVHSETSLRAGEHRAKVTVHMGTCGIAAGARAVMDALMGAIAEANVSDVIVTTSGCAGLCSQEPMATVELTGQKPIVYGKLDANKMRQIFKRHVMQGEVQTSFAIAKG